MTKTASPESQEFSPVESANTVPSRSLLDDWKETCRRMYHKAVAVIQMEFMEGKNQLLNKKQPELVQVTFVNAEMGLPHMQAADELADLQVNEEIIHCIELLRSDMETAIEAHKKLLEKRIKEGERGIIET